MQAVYAQRLQRQRVLRCCVCLLKLALQRLSDSEDKLSSWSGSNATARQLGDLRQPENKDNLSLFYSGEPKCAPRGQIVPVLRREPKCAPTRDSCQSRPPNRCISCAMMATRKSGKIYHLFGLRIARAATGRYNGSVCCAVAYALSCPLRSLRLCWSRVLTPRSQSSITDVSA
jgi:hypothetical protein